MRALRPVIRESLKRAVIRLLGPRLPRHLKFVLAHPGYYRKLKHYIDVEGWLGSKEAIFLFEAACSIGRHTPTVVEIGTMLGKSAIVLGEALRDRDSARVVSIDPFTAEGDLQSEVGNRSMANSLRSSLEHICLENIRRVGLSHVIQLIKGYSHEVVQSWSEPIGMLFIDGNHDYEVVRQDFDDWTPFLVRDGLLVMDDVYLHGGRYAGPARVVRESVIGNEAWHEGRVIGTLYAARKR